MESSIFRRNISFAAIALTAIVVNVFVVNHKIDVATPVIKFNQYVAQTVSGFVRAVQPNSGSIPEKELIEKTIVNKTDLQCMAENIYYEAATQSYIGKIAVGRVVMNRLKSNDRPNSVCGVIYEGRLNSRTSVCQFSWVCDDNRRAINKNSEAWDKSVAVAKEVLHNKEVPDITEGAKFYHATYVSPPWSKTLRKVAQIDDHIFYR